MLRGEDFTDAPVDQSALPGTDQDLLAGPFAHIVVDEAQELTDAEWLILLARCPGARCVAGRACRRDRLRDRRRLVRQDVPRPRTDPDTGEGAGVDLAVHAVPEEFGAGIEGAVDRYVAMTRATQELVILTTS